jgi:hypothetical protein
VLELLLLSPALLCAQEADAKTIITATTANIAMYFVIFILLLSRLFCRPTNATASPPASDTETLL